MLWFILTVFDTQTVQILHNTDSYNTAVFFRYRYTAQLYTRKSMAISFQSAAPWRRRKATLGIQAAMHDILLDAGIDCAVR